jgi:hypothetical protein
MSELGFPQSLSLPLLLTSEGWSWHPPSDSQEFWTGKDADGRRWLVKFRGGFCAVRERAFSIIAQALGISCQSSTFLKVPKKFAPEMAAHPAIQAPEVCQLATWFLDEHGPESSCGDCPLGELDRMWHLAPYDISVLRRSSVTNAIDIARGEMLGMLCEMFEPPGWLFTRDHQFVQIDNELMFALSAGADLWDSAWVQDKGRIRKAGLDEAVHLCEEVLALPDDIFQEALRLPTGYRPQMIWSMREQINAVRPRARAFLKGVSARSGSV